MQTNNNEEANLEALIGNCDIIMSSECKRLSGWEETYFYLNGIEIGNLIYFCGSMDIRLYVHKESPPSDIITFGSKISLHKWRDMEQGLIAKSKRILMKAMLGIK